METQTFLYSRARGCQLHHYKEVFYADSDIFLCISCAQNKLELAGVGYPNLFSLLPYGQVAQAWWGSHAFLEVWNNWDWKETWEVSSPICAWSRETFKIRSGCGEPCLVKCKISILVSSQKTDCLITRFVSFFSCLNFFPAICDPCLSSLALCTTKESLALHCPVPIRQLKKCQLALPLFFFSLHWTNPVFLPCMCLYLLVSAPALYASSTEFSESSKLGTVFQFFGIMSPE